MHARFGFADVRAALAADTHTQPQLQALAQEAAAALLRYLAEQQTQEVLLQLCTSAFQGPRTQQSLWAQKMLLLLALTATDPYPGVLWTHSDEHGRLALRRFLDVLERELAELQLGHPRGEQPLQARLAGFVPRYRSYEAFCHAMCLVCLHL